MNGCRVLLPLLLLLCTGVVAAAAAAVRRRVPDVWVRVFFNPPADG